MSMWLPSFVRVSSRRGRGKGVPLFDSVRHRQNRCDNADARAQEALGSGPFLSGVSPLPQIGVVAATNAIDTDGVPVPAVRWGVLDCGREEGLRSWLGGKVATVDNLILI
eukprot:6240996-Heterocapsa_arctica.AAC.1